MDTIHPDSLGIVLGFGLGNPEIRPFASHYEIGPRQQTQTFQEKRRRSRRLVLLERRLSTKGGFGLFDVHRQFQLRGMGHRKQIDGYFQIQLLFVENVLGRSFVRRKQAHLFLQRGLSGDFGQRLIGSRYRMGKRISAGLI